MWLVADSIGDRFVWLRWSACRLCIHIKSVVTLISINKGIDPVRSVNIGRVKVKVVNVCVLGKQIINRMDG